MNAIKILEKGECDIIATVSSDGRPYGVSVSYRYANNLLYIHCAVKGHKLDNLASNPRVPFCMVVGTEVLADKFAARCESAIVFGKACELTGDEKARIE
jgi:nitroimidazol reductase NimA-like FMN-containing flavoprotein (pyridoxamine 5'-phosphate oxidase superfamily)